MSGFIIKIIAIISMTIDHIGVHLLWGTDLYNYARIIGRVAMPLFCFMISEGYAHTHSLKKYIGRMALFAVLFEVGLYILYRITGENYCLSINIFLTLTSGLICLALVKSKKWYLKLVSLPVLVLVALSDFDYGLYGVLMILIFGCVKSNYIRFALMLCLNAFFIELLPLIPFLSEYIDSFNSMQWFSMLAMIPIFLYNGKRGRGSKWFFYIYYPAHIGLIMLISFLI